MTYLYKCTKCNLIYEIEKRMKDSDKKEYCEACKTELTRVYKVGSIGTSDGVKI